MLSHFLLVFQKNTTQTNKNVCVCVYLYKGHWRITECFHDLIYHPSVTVPTSQLLSHDTKTDECEDGEKEVTVRFWHDQLFSKPPKYGGNVAWHQDYRYCF